MSERIAEFHAPAGNGGVFCATWPRDARGRELRVAGAALHELLRWWADALDADRDAAAESEYASWFPAANTEEKNA